MTEEYALKVTSAIHTMYYLVPNYHCPLYLVCHYTYQMSQGITIRPSDAGSESYIYKNTIPGS